MALSHGQNKVVVNNLLVYLDAANHRSYPGSGTTWFDVSGNALNGTLVNGPAFNSAFSGGFVFDSVNDHVTLPSGFNAFPNGLTINAFVNFGNPTNWERIMDFGNGQASDNILFTRAFTSNTLHFELFNGSTSRGSCQIANGVLNNTIAQYTVTLNGSQCIMYRNGVILQTFSYAFLPTNILRTVNYIGRSNWSADSYFESNIYTFQIYSRPLTQAEILQNFNALKRRFSL
jgi:hypothetical protein